MVIIFDNFSLLFMVTQFCFHKKKECSKSGLIFNKHRIILRKTVLCLNHYLPVDPLVLPDSPTQLTRYRTVLRTQGGESPIDESGFIVIGETVNYGQLEMVQFCNKQGSPQGQDHYCLFILFASGHLWVYLGKVKKYRRSILTQGVFKILMCFACFTLSLSYYRVMRWKLQCY